MSCGINFHEEECFEESSLAGSSLELNVATAAGRFLTAAQQDGKYPLAELGDLIANSFSFVDNFDELNAFLNKILPAGFECAEQAVKDAFSLSEAVVKISLKAETRNNTITYYSGTGTVFKVGSELYIFTNKHVLDVPQIKKASGEYRQALFVILDGNVSIDVSHYCVIEHPQFLDVVKIVVDKKDIGRFTNAFTMERPKCYEIDRLVEILRTYPTKETDSGYLFVCIGHPLGLPKKRVSAASACKRIDLVASVTTVPTSSPTSAPASTVPASSSAVPTSAHVLLTHRAPTFRGSSGSIVFAIPMYSEGGKEQGIHVAEQLASGPLKSIAGIHFRRTDDAKLNGFVTLPDMFNF